MSRTGASVAKLAEDVREDLGDIATEMAALRQRIEVLGESARAINGLGGACAGWADHLSTLIGEVKKEATEVPAKLLGTPIREITQIVNSDHVKAVKAAKDGRSETTPTQ